MFTGLVEATGQLVARRATSTGHRFVVRHPLGELDEGESVSVNGVCLTVVKPTSERFEADVSTETIRVTTLGSLSEGTRLNLERALRSGDRFGGHLVTGHVDGVAEIRALSPIGDSRRVVVSLPRGTAAFVAAKGSVALDGVSLTVNSVGELDFDVMLIPHTLEATNLAELEVGKRLNLEVDLVARYVARWGEKRASGDEEAALRGGNSEALEQALKRSGLM
jgi:riboflavin synthase